MLLVILILILVFGGAGYWGGGRYAPGYGGHFGIGAVVLVLFILYLLGYLGGAAPRHLFQ